MTRFLMLIAILFGWTRIADAQTDVSSVIVYWTQDNLAEQATYQPYSQPTITPDKGTKVYVRIYRTAEASLPANFFSLDFNNGGDYNHELSTTHSLVTFDDCAGPLNTVIWAGVNTNDGAVRITVNWQDPNEVKEPEFDLQPSTYNFGDVEIGGTSSTKSFTLTNVGTGSGNGSVALDNGSQFRIVSGGGSFTLDPNQSKQIQVVFEPSSQGNKSDYLDILKPGSNDYYVYSELSGSGVITSTGCNLTVNVNNINPSSPFPGNWGFVHVYDDPDNVEIFQTSNGVATGTVPYGEYHIEAYHDPDPSLTIFGEEYWGSLSGVTLNEPSKEIDLNRSMPYIKTISIINPETGQDVYGGDEVEAGTLLKISVEVERPSGYPIESRVRLVLDRDKVEPYDDFDEFSNSEHISGGGTEYFEFYFTPQELGDYYAVAGAQVYTYKWLITDGTAWTNELYFKVVEQPGGTPCQGNEQWPLSTIYPTTSWERVENMWAGEFAVFYVVNGREYTWSLCESDGGYANYNSQLTLRRESDNSFLAYNDNACGNDGKITWTANFTGKVRLLVNEIDCQANNSSTNLAYRISSGSTPVSDIKITVKNIPMGSSSLPGNNGRVVLFDPDYQPIDSAFTNSDGIVYFSGIPLGEGYKVEAYHNPSNPTTIFGEEFWGGEEDITHQGSPTDAIVIRTMPYMYNIRVLNAATEQDISGSVGIGTPLKIKVYVKNPGYDISTKVDLVLDRDMSEPYDFEKLSDLQGVSGDGGEKIFIFNYTPEEPGEYFGVAGTQANTGGNRWPYTDGLAWDSSPLFTVLGVSDLIMTPDYWDFGNVYAGQTSDSKVFTLKNEGSWNAEGEISFIGGEWFSIVRGGGSFSLAPNESIEIEVVFHPDEPGHTLDELFAITSDGNYTAFAEIEGTGIEILDLTDFFGNVVARSSIWSGQYQMINFENSDGGYIILPFDKKAGDSPQISELIDDPVLAEALYNIWLFDRYWDYADEDYFLEFRNFYDLDKWWETESLHEFMVNDITRSKRKSDRILIGNMAFFGANEILKAKVTGGASLFGLISGGLLEFFNHNQLEGLSEQDVQPLILANAFYGGDLKVFQQMQGSLLTEFFVETIHLLKDIKSIYNDLEFAADIGDAAYFSSIGDLTNAVESIDNLANNLNGLLLGLAYDNLADVVSSASGLPELKEQVKLYAWLHDAYFDAIYTVSDDLLKIKKEINSLNNSSFTPTNASLLKELTFEFSQKYVLLFHGLQAGLTRMQLNHIQHIRNTQSNFVSYFIGARESYLDDLKVDYPSVTSHYNNYISILNAFNSKSIGYYAAYSGALSTLKEKLTSMVRVSHTGDNEGNVFVGESVNVLFTVTSDYKQDINLEAPVIIDDSGLLSINASASENTLAPGESTIVSADVGVPINWFTSENPGLHDLIIRLNWEVGGQSFTNDYKLNLTIGSRVNIVDVSTDRNIYVPGETVLFEVKFENPDFKNVESLAKMLLQPKDEPSSIMFGHNPVNNRFVMDSSPLPDGPYGAWGTRSYLIGSGELLTPVTYTNRSFYLVPAISIDDLTSFNWDDYAIIFPANDLEAAEDIKYLTGLDSEDFYQIEDHSLDFLKGIANSRDVILLGGHVANPLVADLTTTSLNEEGDAIVKLFPNAHGSNNALVIAGYLLRDTQIASMGFINQFKRLEDLIPSTPVLEKVIQIRDAIHLEWTPSPEDNVTHYDIYRGTTSDAISQIGSVSIGDNSFIDYDLQTDTEYLYKLKAINYNGKESNFSNELSIVFTTLLPEVTTSGITDIAETTAKSGGNVSSDGGAKIIARGIAWSTSDDPTVENNEGITMDGEGTGVFISNLSGLLPGKEYYVKAYAENSVGIAYGTQKSFITDTRQPEYFSLNLAVDPAQGGTVEGAGEYLSGNEIVLQANPEDGFEFLNWRKDGVAISNDSIFTYLMPSEDVILIAHFIETGIDIYELDIDILPEGSGTVSGAGKFEEGSSVKLIAFALEGYEFVSWTNIDNEQINTDSHFTFIMPASDVTLKANFSLSDYSLKINSVPKDAGILSGEGIYQTGDIIEISAIPKPDFKFVNWTDENGNEISTDSAYKFDMPPRDISYTANFSELVAISLSEALDNDDLIFTTGGDAEWFGQTSTTFDGIDAAESGKISHNQQTWLEISVKGPGTFSFWWKVSSEKNYDFLMFFINDELQSSLSGESDWHQKVYNLDGEVNIVRWVYSKDWAVDHGQDRGWIDRVEFIASDKEDQLYELHLMPSPDGAGHVSGAGEFARGTEIEINASPNQGYRFVNWTENDAEISTEAEYSFEMPDRDVALTANFEDDIVTVTLCEALDNCDLEFTTGGHAEWFGQTQVTYDGVDAAQSGEITHDQQTWLETMIEGPGELTFRWKVSSESGYDFLEFFINDVRQDRISGNVDWQMKEYVLEDGLNTIRWIYTKDRSNSEGEDRGWVDQVAFITSKEVITYNLSIDINPANSGTVSGSGKYEEGEEATLTATPSDGYKFINWTDQGGEEISDLSETVFIMPAIDAIITANFQLITSALAVDGDATDSGIKIFPNPAFDEVHIHSKSYITGIKIIDMMGRVVYIEKPESPVTVINLSQFSRGLYIVNIVAETGEIKTRLEILK